MDLLVVLVLLAVFAFALARSRRERESRRAAATTANLQADDWGLRRWLADGRYEEVAWDEMREVRAITLPRGPWDSRVRLVFDGGGERGCIVPIDAAEQFGVLTSLSRLPGFDHRALADVLQNERTGQEVLWSKTST
ncbi:MAG TPA: hypothetical protein VGZ52_01860 [Acidimicrobiales bacterium]|jgi:hypothetical protein|nr:hypothetical protein [Acidimicrobiales bacterium]